MLEPIRKQYKIKASKEAVWQALTDPKEIAKWGAGPAEMTAEQGKDFSLWGGDIWGTNREVVQGEKLVQAWYSNDDPGQRTVVTFTLEAGDEMTILHLLHEKVGDVNYQNIEHGWDEFYCGPLKEYLESR